MRKIEKILMKTNATTKLKLLIIAISCVFAGFYIIYLSVSVAQGEFVPPGTLNYNEPTADGGKYKLLVEKNKEYILTISGSLNSAKDPVVYLYKTFWRLSGVIINQSNNQLESVQFISEKTGFYYVTIRHSTDGFFALQFVQQDLTGPVSSTAYFNGWRIFLTFFPFCLSVTGLILFDFKLKKEYREIKSYSKKNPNFKECPNCKRLNEKNSGYCEICGHVFELPETIYPVWDE